jgi:Fic-DOC domain mobile mystery protein B
VDAKDERDACTAINLEDTAALKPNLATQRELDQWEFQNILEARSWALATRRLKDTDPFSEPYIRELHRRMFNRTWQWAGKYRKRDTNLGVPHVEIRERLGQLLGNARYWIENKTVDLDEAAVRLHYDSVFIHPFSNGNGRHARLLADVVASKFGREPFTWGSKELVDPGPVRQEYIRCLKLADENNDNIQPLLKFARS